MASVAFLNYKMPCVSVLSVLVAWSGGFRRVKSSFVAISFPMLLLLVGIYPGRASSIIIGY